MLQTDNKSFRPRPINTNWGPGAVYTNWGPGPVNTNRGPGPVNTNKGARAGAQGQDRGPGNTRTPYKSHVLNSYLIWQFKEPCLFHASLSLLNYEM